MKINIKKLIPRFIKIKLNEVLGRVNQYKGNYLSWGEALSDSEGYDSVELLNRVIKGNESVLAGKATYERDGVLFDKVSYAMELNSCLLLAYCHTDSFNKFTVVDFGGSLGTVFRQFEEFTNFSLDFQWNIVEQKILFDYVLPILGVKILLSE